jgi:iron uptake system component EfeO
MFLRFHMQGFHRIEALIYRDDSVVAAIPYAKDLVRLWGDLRTALMNPSKYNFCDWWAGTIGLATEIGAKKISSEEETYSDHSILIFHNNFVGIRQAAAPFIRRLSSSGSNGTAVAEGALAALDAADRSVAPFVRKGVTSPVMSVLALALH